MARTSLELRRVRQARRRQISGGLRVDSPGESPGSILTPAEQIGLFLRSTRQAQNLSQEQLASLTRSRPGRVSRAMISAVERGRHLPGLEVLLTLSQVLHVSPAEVLERLELARGEPLDKRGMTFEELDGKASESFWAGDPRRAVACYDAMLRVLEHERSTDDEDRERKVATTELRRGAALRRCGAMTAARTSIERAITLSDSMPEIQTQAYLVLAATLLHLGKLPLARDSAARAVDLSAGVDDVKLRGWCWIEKGEVLAASGDHAEARRAFVKARRHVRAAGDLPHAVKVEGNIGHCLHQLGCQAEARRCYLRAVALSRRHKLPASEALWLVELGRLALATRKPDEADACAAAALKIAKPKEDFLTCFRAEWLRHLVRQATGPEEPDRHRVAYLKRLYIKLEEHRGVEEILQFKRAYASPSDRGK